MLELESVQSHPSIHSSFWLHPCLLFCFRLTMAGRGKPPVADEDADCVTQAELRAFTDNNIEAINVNHARYAATLEGIERKVSSIVDRLEALEVRIPLAAHELDGNEQDERARRDEELRCHLVHNHQGMGGINDNNHDNHDPSTEVKFTTPAFYGAYDVEVYLDCEMIVEQKLNSHLIPEVHKLDKLLVNLMILL
jgi:hypothetical protein